MVDASLESYCVVVLRNWYRKYIIYIVTFFQSWNWPEIFRKYAKLNKIKSGKIIGLRPMSTFNTVRETKGSYRVKLDLDEFSLVALECKQHQKMLVAKHGRPLVSLWTDLTVQHGLKCFQKGSFCAYLVINWMIFTSSIS